MGQSFKELTVWLEKQEECLKVKQDEIKVEQQNNQQNKI